MVWHGHFVGVASHDFGTYAGGFGWAVINLADADSTSSRSPSGRITSWLIPRLSPPSSSTTARADLRRYHEVFSNTADHSLLQGPDPETPLRAMVGYRPGGDCVPQGPESGADRGIPIRRTEFG